MAFFYNPNSYANALYGTPFSTYRRPSPPPQTYYARSVDPYIQALAEEQVARNALQEAMQREHQARQHRAEEEARVRALAEQEARARAARRQRPQTMYGNPFAYGRPSYDFAPVDDDDCEEDYSPFDFFGHGSRRPMRTQPVPRMARSQSRTRPQPVYEQQPRPEPVRRQTPVENVKIRISSPGPSVPAERLNEAASKIQSLYRTYTARKAAFADVEAIKQSFESLRSSFSCPTSLEFQDDHTAPDTSATPEARPRLAYTSSNTPVHAYEDQLVKLLQKLDAIESHGDPRVRDARRTIVKAIEEELGNIDATIRRMWEECVNSAKTPTQEGTDSDKATAEEPMETEKDNAAAEMLLTMDTEEGRVPEFVSTAASTATEAEPVNQVGEELPADADVAAPPRDVEVEAMDTSSIPIAEDIDVSLADVDAVPDVSLPPQPESSTASEVLHESVLSASQVLPESESFATSHSLPDSESSTVSKPVGADVVPTTALEPTFEEPDSDSESENEDAEPSTPLAASVPLPLDSSPSLSPRHHVTVEDAPDDDEDGEMVTVEEVIEPLKSQVESKQDSDFVMV